MAVLDQYLRIAWHERHAGFSFFFISLGTPMSMSQFLAWVMG
jgi:hypothetical protein